MLDWIFAEPKNPQPCFACKAIILTPRGINIAAKILNPSNKGQLVMLLENYVPLIKIKNTEGVYLYDADQWLCGACLNTHFESIRKIYGRPNLAGDATASTTATELSTEGT